MVEVAFRVTLVFVQVNGPVLVAVTVPGVVSVCTTVVEAVAVHPVEV
jgi:hypothetical protein